MTEVFFRGGDSDEYLGKHSRLKISPGVSFATSVSQEVNVKVFVLIADSNLNSHDSTNGDFEANSEKKLLSKNEPNADEYDDVYCGIGSFKPKCLQPCASMPAFVFFQGIAGFTSSCLSVYISSQLTTLERTFGFGSATGGFIIACNDIGYLICILFMSHFARRTHIPRVLYLVTLFYGISALVCCIPYFITSEKFRLSNTLSMQSPTQNISRFSQKTSTNLCSRNKTSFDIISRSACDETESGDQSSSLFGLTKYESTVAVVLITSGMILQGFTKAPRYPFSSTYIDDNAKAKSAMYIGIAMGISILGPAVAFSVGGLFSRIYVTLEATDMSYRDPRWIGAWWLGFLVFGLVAILIATPLLFFPRHLLPKSQRLRVEESGEKQSFRLKDLQGLLKALVRLFTNPVYCPLVIAQIATQMAVAGNISFIAKYIETQFYLPVWKANFMIGACALLAAATGALAGGKIITRFKLTLASCVKLLIVLYAISILFTIPYLFLICPRQNVKADWNSIGVKYGDMLNNTACLDDCFCDRLPMSPVCDVEMGVTYYSACHAGCTAKNGTLYYDCSCVPSGEVLSGYCPTTCSALTPFIIFLTIASFFGACSLMSFITITMRCVPEADKPLALGLSSFLYNLLGSMPGPMLFGTMIDTLCLVWNTKCNRTGSCALYDADSFRYAFHGLVGGLRIFSLFLLLIVLRNVLKKKSSGLKHTHHNNKSMLDAVSNVDVNDTKQRNVDGSGMCSDISQGKVDIQNYEMEIVAPPRK